MIRAIFFDIDDTLCDRTSVKTKALRRAWNVLVENRGEECDFDRFYSAYEVRTGSYLPRLKTFEMVLDDINLKDEGLAGGLEAAYSETIRADLRLFDGVRDVLSTLKRSFKLGVISNAPSDSQREKIRILDLAPYFSSVTISGEVGVQKPDERIFRIAMDSLGETAETSAYVGDSPELDVSGAKMAGMFAVWANMRGVDYSGPLPPDLVIRAPRELADVHWDSVRG
jgi:HAD superfamily hydrolase (TIGR01549 family)